MVDPSGVKDLGIDGVGDLEVTVASDRNARQLELSLIWAAVSGNSTDGEHPLVQAEQAARSQLVGQDAIANGAQVFGVILGFPVVDQVRSP